MYVFQGSTDQGHAFFGDTDPDGIAIADPDGDLYCAFSVKRGGLREMFGLAAWRRGIGAFLRGHRIGRRVGDPWTLPTVVVIQGDRVIWRHDGRHAGDHPDVARLPELIASRR